MATRKKGKVGAQRLLLSIFLLVVFAAAATYFSGFDPETASFAPQSAPGEPQNTSAHKNSVSTARPSPTPAKMPGGRIVVMVLDVGKADSILVVTPNKRAMLVDAGEKNAYPVIEDALERLGITKLDVVVATHPHNDHIGGMKSVLENYEVGELYAPKISSDTATYEGFVKAMNQKKLKPKEARAGVTIPFDPDVSVDVLAPLNYEYDNMNNCSAVLRVTFGQVTFLLTADIEKEAERDILDAYDADALRANVLKVAHHGSATSSTGRFLSAVHPEVAVISTAPVANSSTPHKDVIGRLSDLDAAILRTDRDGTIMLISDGKSIDYQ